MEWLRFTAGLTGWVAGSRISVSTIVCIVCVCIVGKNFVGVRVCLTTVKDVVVVVIAGTTFLFWA